MKLILDEGLPMRAAVALREAAHDARHVLELGMAGASDQAVLDRAWGGRYHPGRRLSPDSRCHGGRPALGDPRACRRPLGPFPCRSVVKGA